MLFRSAVDIDFPEYREEKWGQADEVLKADLTDYDWMAVLSLLEDCKHSDLEVMLQFGEELIDWEDAIPIKNHEILKSEAKRLAKLDEIIVAQSNRTDELCTYTDESGETSAPLSVILAQAVNHTAEHRAQLSTILKMHGFHLDLDDKDLWAYYFKILKK